MPPSLRLRPHLRCVALSQLLLALALPLCADAASAAAHMQPYRSEAEFAAALERWRTESQKLVAERTRRSATAGIANMAPSPTAPMAVAQDSAAKAAPSSEAKAESRAADPAGNAESITNVQTAGVDEGGIVKRAGEHLIVLRRGRLFTVRVGGDRLERGAMTDAYAPGADPSGAWYDELLVSGNIVVVIGFSYARGGTEIGLFELCPDGALAWRATHHLRSFDYYSSRNYASRLVGRRLVFYTPSYLNPWGQPNESAMPAQRRWMPGGVPDAFTRILPATRIYRTDDDFQPGTTLALHTVTSCELGGASMACDSSAVLGPAGRVFYVSAGSVYVWTSRWRGRHAAATRPGTSHDAPQSAVFRLPLDGSAPSGIKTAGVPLDQMSFLEDGAGHLNVLLREAGDGDAMWGHERNRGAMALLRLPLAALGDGRGVAAREHYRRVPGSTGWAAQNRYVGDWLLWGGADGAWATRYADADGAVATLKPGHAVERIEALGSHAVLVGNGAIAASLHLPSMPPTTAWPDRMRSTDSDLHFSAVRLGRSDAQLDNRLTLPGQRQGESRTHGFFYRATGADEGVLGLPVLRDGRAMRSGGVYAQGQGAAAVVFVRQRDLRFASLGELASRSGGGSADDGCKVSCIDWYGNARPIFIGERVFALLGYELVEGRIERGWRRDAESIEERRRVSFAPAPRYGTRPNPFAE